MTFKIQIDLENAGMQTGPDIAQALRAVAAEVEQYPAPMRRAAESITDASGNVVGHWKVTRTN